MLSGSIVLNTTKYLHVQNSYNFQFSRHFVFALLKRLVVSLTKNFLGGGGKSWTGKGNFFESRKDVKLHKQKIDFFKKLIFLNLKIADIFCFSLRKKIFFLVLLTRPVLILLLSQRTKMASRMWLLRTALQRSSSFLRSRCVPTMHSTTKVS